MGVPLASPGPAKYDDLSKNAIKTISELEKNKMMEKSFKQYNA